MVADSSDIRIAGPIVAAAAAVESSIAPGAARSQAQAPGRDWRFDARHRTVGSDGRDPGAGRGPLLTPLIRCRRGGDRLAEAQTSYDAAKGEASPPGWGARSPHRCGDRGAGAQRRDRGRETVPLQANPSRVGVQDKERLGSPGEPGAANSMRRTPTPKLRRTTPPALRPPKGISLPPRAALAALKPVDIKPEETGLTAAKQAVERERAANPMSRLAASIYRVSTSDLRDEDHPGRAQVRDAVPGRPDGWRHARRWVDLGVA